MSISSPSAQRSTTVFGIALSELFILLLFLAILLWIATTPAKSETPEFRIAALETRIKELEERLSMLRSENARMKSELEEQDQLLSLLWQLYEKKPVTLTPGTPEWRKWLKEWHARAEQSEAGGRGHPNCLGKNAGALLRLTITDSGISAQAVGETASAAVSQIASARELIAQGTVPIQRFEELGISILRWSEQHKPACRFDVIFVDKTTLKAPYAAALRAIDKVFYKTERRA